MMHNDLIERVRGVMTPALVIHHDLVIQKARGIHLEDAAGRRYMDFTSGVAVANVGHNHPKVVEAIRKQAGDLVHAGCVFYYEPLAELPELLRSVMPAGLDMFFFSNSGAEAVEGALKLARYHTGRQGIIAFAGSFHGRTFGALSLTSSSSRYRRRYHPLLPSVYHAPYPYCYRCPVGGTPGRCGMECFKQLEGILKHLIVPEDVACVIIEPVLGEGGYVVPPAKYLKKLRDLCTRWGILLILDEVQTGMGRTGTWFASEHFGIVPDIMTMAKGIANGLPLSAVVSNKAIMQSWAPGAHGTTFGGNPVSLAAAAAVVNVIQEEGLIENAASMGRLALERLSLMKEKHSSIGDVRGLGLMIGVELVRDGKEPDRARVEKVLRRCLDKGLVLIECGEDKNVIRLAPPLTIKREELEKGLDLIEEALAETA